MTNIFPSSSYAESSSIAQSSSSSSNAAVLEGMYDVFLSFRGEDTRRGFVSHLYTALVDRRIHTFRDDDRLESGKSIKEELLKAIKDSKIAIIIFSENYANSSWCLNELVHIMEVKPPKIIIPVFYGVEPSDILHQRNEVAKALEKHETDGRMQRWKEALTEHGPDGRMQRWEEVITKAEKPDGRMQRWKEALTEAASLRGWDVLSSDRTEAECIRQIVYHVLSELIRQLPSRPLVGMERRANMVIEKLRVEECDKIFKVGIWGMGGGGKTTTTRAVFNQISLSFDSSCFLVFPFGEISQNGLKKLQKTLLSEILYINEIDIIDTEHGINMIREILKYKKVLIVLDDVTHQEQLRALAPEHNCFGPGSRIIITSRDKQLLNKLDEIYEVELLNESEAMQLFSWHAFLTTEPEKDFAELSHAVVKYAGGLPLALTALGSHLLGLSWKEWTSEISKLKMVPYTGIIENLKISYDALDDIDKSIFLDIACFFRGWKVDVVTTILDSFKPYNKRGISILQRKSLISININCCIEMHDLVQEMGWIIARGQKKRSYILDVLSGERGIVQTSLLMGQLVSNVTLVGKKRFVLADYIYDMLQKRNLDVLSGAGNAEPHKDVAQLSKEVITHAEGLPLIIQESGFHLHGLSVREWSSQTRSFQERGILSSMTNIFPSSSSVESSSSTQSSSSSSDPAVLDGMYDVYLSFRGEDTRRGFVSHLYWALIERGIHTFRDDEILETHKPIVPELLEAINNSKIVIVIFSKNYVTSSWCLDELVHIMKFEPQKIIIPVFYDVDPSDIRKQRNEVAKALEKHGIDGRMQRWKEALTKAPKFKGWLVFNSHRDEAECVKDIVAHVFGELSHWIPITSETLVGIERRVNKVLQMLMVEKCHEVVMVGIWGMGGAGKTTTAKATFDKLSHLFDGGSCFIKIPHGKCSKDGLMDLQKTLLSQILELKLDEIDIKESRYGKKMVEDKLRGKKILIVLDNVGDRLQLMALAPYRELFGPGSRVIITTRDKQFLNRVDKVYEVELLNESEAMQLFSWCAFGKNKPHEDLTELFHTVVKYATGLPLALRVLGSHLQGLNLEEWRSEISKLKTVFYTGIIENLKISYDELDKIDNSIFLDIACFFRGWKVYVVTTILDSFKPYNKRGISILQRKSLIYIDINGCIEMNDLVQEMGWVIALKQGKRSYILDVLSQKRGIFETSLLMGHLRNVALEGKNTFVLTDYIYDMLLERNRDVKSWAGKSSTRRPIVSSQILTLVESGWPVPRNFPIYRATDMSHFKKENLKMVPENLQLEYLQHFDLQGCTKLEEFPKIEGRNITSDLENINLSGTQVTSVPDSARNFPALRKLLLPSAERPSNTSEDKWVNDFLEELDRSHSQNLVELHPSFGVHEKLQVVNLRECSNLRILPKRLQMRSLKLLILHHCSNLDKFPEIDVKMMSGLEVLDLGHTGIRRLPNSIRYLTGLKTLILEGCQRLGYKLPLEKRSSKVLLPDYLMLNEQTITDLELLFIPSQANNNNASSVSSIIAVTVPNIYGFPRILITLPSFPQLSHVNLKDCNLSHLVIPQSFLPSLQKLELSDNFLQGLRISKDCLCSLRLLDLSVHSSFGIKLSSSQMEMSRLQDLFGHLGVNSSMVYLINSTSETPESISGNADFSESDNDVKTVWAITAPFDWVALFHILPKRHSLLTVLSPGTKFPEGFGESNGEVRLPPIQSCTNFRGLAICARIRTNTSLMAERVSIKYFDASRSLEYPITSNNIIFIYIPKAACFESSSSDGEHQRICLLEACLDDILVASDEVQWGTLLLYKDDDGETYYDRISDSNEHGEKGYLKVLSSEIQETIKVHRPNLHPYSQIQQSNMDASYSLSTFERGARGKYEYDVFLSFTGEDTRKGFVSHLYQALSDRGIHTFLDDRNGEPFAALEAIDKSKIAIIVFSKSYTSSRSCLDHLIKIQENDNIIFFPVFRDVDPFDIPDQKDIVDALKYATKFSGWVISAGHKQLRVGNQAECVQQIVSLVSRIRAKGIYKYEVFVTFREEEPQKGFVRHLDQTLTERGFHTFLDDEKEKSIDPEFLEAIDKSKIAIVVFSKNYASSPWSLDNLLRILENDNIIFIPVFYDIDPFDIRDQKNDVAEALLELSKHGPKFTDNLQKWKEALKYATNFSGWVLSSKHKRFRFVDELGCIQQILGSVFLELSQSNTNSRKDLVGIERRADKVMSMLRVGESHTVRMIGVLGRSGAGKTTLAAYIFHNLSDLYGASCFLQIHADERWDDQYLKDLQKTLLSNILHSDSICISHCDEGVRMIKNKLKSKRVLIVIDNVDHEQQLEALGLDKKSLGNGSRVIITTADDRLLNKVDETYEIELLSKNEAMQLFSWHAFPNRSYPPEIFANPSGQAANFASGLPLALNMLGSLFRGFKNSEEWSNAIHKLQNSPDDKIDTIVQTSFDGLDETDKRTFLDIACFLKGEKVTNAMKILSSFEEFPKNICEGFLEKRIRNLVEKCLVSIDPDHNALREHKYTVNVHDAVRQSVQNIVEKDYPGSKLWEAKKAFNVLNGDGECGAVEVIVLRNGWKTTDLSISNETFERMKKLRLLWLSGIHCSTDHFKNLPRELRWIDWEGYPCDSLPASFEGQNLAGLIMKNSNISNPISGEKTLWNLTIMDFSLCEYMTATPDFSLVPCLEELYLCHCERLVDVHSTFGYHRRLRLVNFEGCINLVNLPEIDHEMDNLEELILRKTGITGLPFSAGNLTGLYELNLSCCEDFELIPPDHSTSPLLSVKAITTTRRNLFLPSFSEITCLDLRSCHLSNFFIPESWLPSLAELKLGHNSLQELLISKKCLSSIKLLDLSGNICEHEETDKHNLFNHYKDQSIVSLISCKTESAPHQMSVEVPKQVPQCTSHFDWKVMLSVLHDRDSDISMCFPGSEIPMFFEHQMTGYECELILLESPTWLNAKFRGLAICAVAQSSVDVISAKHCFNRVLFSRHNEEYKGDQLVLYFVPSKYVRYWVSDPKKRESQGQVCLLHADGNMKWGIRIMYADEDDVIHNIKMATRNKNDGKESYLKVLWGNS